MAKRKKKRGGKPHRKRASKPEVVSRPDKGLPPPGEAAATTGEREVPRWVADEGNLYWRGRVIMHLATQATAERMLLNEFETRGWASPIPNPLPRRRFGDATGNRRNAIKNLNRHQAEIIFKSVPGGLMLWCAALDTDTNNTNV